MASMLLQTCGRRACRLPRALRRQPQPGEAPRGPSGGSGGEEGKRSRPAAPGPALGVRVRPRCRPAREACAAGGAEGPGAGGGGREGGRRRRRRLGAPGVGGEVVAGEKGRGGGPGWLPAVLRSRRAGAGHGASPLPPSAASRCAFWRGAAVGWAAGPSLPRRLVSWRSLPCQGGLRGCFPLTAVRTHASLQGQLGGEAKNVGLVKVQERVTAFQSCLPCAQCSLAVESRCH